VRSQYRIAMAFMRHHPNYHSISDFRKNPSGLKTCFVSFFLKDADLIGCEIIAIDGKKQSAQQ
jgi:hypothetical protein